MSANNLPWPGAQDDRPATTAHSGLMPKLGAASATLGGFTVTGGGGRGSTINTSAATTSKAGAQSATDKTRADALWNNHPIVRVHRAAALNITNGGAGTALTWDTTDYDSHGMWAGANPTRLTVPAAWPGYYLIVGGIRFAAAAAGRRALWVQNQAAATFGWAEDYADAGGLEQTSLIVVDRLALNGGDWVDLRGFESTGATVAIQPGTGVFITARWERGL